MVQILFCTCVGFVTFIWIYLTARKGLLNFRYTVGWLLLSTFGILAGLIIPLIAPIANFLAITPAALLAIGGIVLLIAICIQLSISISGLHERQRRLTEELAHIRQSLDRFTSENAK